MGGRKQIPLVRQNSCFDKEDLNKEKEKRPLLLKLKVKLNVTLESLSEDSRAQKTINDLNVTLKA